MRRFRNGIRVGMFLIGWMVVGESFARAQSADVWPVSPMVKVLQPDTRPPSYSYPNYTYTSVNLYAAQNEFEPFQIAIHNSGASALTIGNMCIQGGSLTDGAGHTIAEAVAGTGGNILIYREGYVSVGDIPSTQLQFDPSHDPHQKSSSPEGIFYDPLKYPGSAYPNGHGLVPDPLIPKVDDYFYQTRNAFPATIQSGTTQGFWIEIYVPQSQTPGLYSGQIGIFTGSTCGGSPSWTVNISLRVWSFALPSTPSLKSGFPLDYTGLPIGHPGVIAGSTIQQTDYPKIRDLISLYTVALLRHRLTNPEASFPANVNTATPNDPVNGWGIFDTYIRPLLDGTGSLTIYDVSGMVPTTFNMDTGKLPHAKLTTFRLRDSGSCCKGVQSYYLSWDQHFNTAHSWFNWNGSTGEGPKSGTRLYNIPVDEPCAATDWSAITSVEPSLHATNPPNIIMETTSIKRANGTDTACQPPSNVAAKIDLYTVPVQMMEDKPGGKDIYQLSQRSQYSAEVWWYHGCSMHNCSDVNKYPTPDADDILHTHFPTFMADLPNIYSRIQPWMTELYNIQGIYYYDVAHSYGSHFVNYTSKSPINGCDFTDMWTHIYCSGGNGDGTLFYPGIPTASGAVTVGIAGTTQIPIDSIRLKLIREGMEDYEYIQKLKDMGQGSNADLQANSLGGTASDGPFLSSDCPNTSPGVNNLNDHCFTKDASNTALYAARDRLAQAINLSWLPAVFLLN